MDEALLVFQVGGRRIAVPLADLVGVAEARVLPLPLAPPAHVGIMLHAGTVYPVFDPLRLLGLGALPGPPDLVVLLDVRGQGVGLACRRVEGSAPLGERLGVLAGDGHEQVRVGGWPAVYPDLPRALDAALGRRAEAG